MDTLQSDTPHRFEYLMQNVEGSYSVLGKWVIGKAFDQYTFSQVLAPSSFDTLIEEIEPVSNWLQPDGLPGAWHRVKIAPAEPTANTRFITFHTPGTSTLPQASMLRGDKVTRIALKGVGFDDSMLVSDPGSVPPYTIGDLSSNAHVSMIAAHDEAGVARQRYYILNGSYLEAGGIVRIQGVVPDATVEATIAGDVLAVTYLFPDAVDADVLKVFAPSVTTVLVNDALVSFSREGPHVVFPARRQGDGSPNP
jgi:hypothetical protein